MSQNNNEVISAPISIKNETGIHARPASHIFQTAGKYKSTIQLKKGDKVVNAKSIIAILGLGVKYQESIQVLAQGEDAQQAVDHIVKEIEEGLGEEVGHSGKSNLSEKQKESPSMVNDKNVIVDFSGEVVLDGVVASPGLVIGRSYQVVEENIAVEENSSHNARELETFERSILNLKAKINQDIDIARLAKHSTKVEIFKAHLKILEDEELIDNAKSNIKSGKTAGFGWVMAVNSAIDVLNSTGNQILMERTADLKDLKNRLLKFILGKPDDSNVSYGENTIIVAKDLVPSDVAKFDSRVVGVLLAFGSATSHVALMLRNMGTPCLVAIGESALNISNDTNIVLDANESTILVNASDDKLVTIADKQKELNLIKQINVENSKKPAITKDGVTISVKGNISNPAEAQKAFDLGAEGVGLLRTEFLFFNSHNAPSLNEQHSLYQSCLDAMQGGYITYRTLDVGGDKPLDYVRIGHEENPILGLRGVRNYTLNMEVFLTQIRAILKVKPLKLCKIMIPMVSEISEMVEMKRILEEEKKKAGITEHIELGTMIEVPSAALMADTMAKYVDFFSIGTNDLAQYTLAMDRGNPNLTARLKNLNPALLKLIKITVDGGNLHGKPTSVCGAMASEIKAIPILLGLGVKELSTSMKSIPDVKALIRNLDFAHCKDVANKALQLESTEDVVKLVKQEFNI